MLVEQVEDKTTMVKDQKVMRSTKLCSKLKLKKPNQKESKCLKETVLSSQLFQEEKKKIKSYKNKNSLLISCQHKIQPGDNNSKTL